MVYSTKVLQKSLLAVTKEWIRVLSEEKMSDGPSLAMFLRWKIAVCVICLMCDLNK